MPIGSYYSTICKRRITRFIYSSLGTLDLHTHIRLKPVIAFLRKYLNENLHSQISILEIGCGSGINAFELYKISNELKINLNYIGIDKSYKAINKANRVLSSLSTAKSKICFFQDEANKAFEKFKKQSFDVILLIDVLEHIQDPQKLLDSYKAFLKDSGLFVVSVPTPLYPKIFGREFHNKIGHLIDGYLLNDLNKLFNNINCELIEYKYNTGLFSNIGCWLYYNKLNFSNKYLNFLKCLILYPFSFLDFYNNSRISSSLFAVYRKKS